MSLEPWTVVFFVILGLLAVIVWLVIQNRQLKNSGEQFRRLADSAHDLIWIINTSGRFVYVSASVENMLGYRPEEVVGKPLDLIASRGSATASYNEISHVLRTNEMRYPRTEIKYVRKDGTRFWVELGINIQRDHSGRITGFYGIARDIDEQHRLRQEMYRLAHFDNLTGLPNRTLFFDRLNTALSRARRQRWKLAVLYMDLDDFKQVNDNLGHEEGDRVLQLTAARLQDAMRHEDTIARIGGDEFAAIVEDVSSTDTLDRICRKLEESIGAPMVTNRGRHHLGVSIGYVQVDPKDAMNAADPDHILSQADRKMYISKRESKVTEDNDSDQP